ncbi:MAG: hypothetical protein OXH78_13775 [Acidimicrobiaceae bacterium]|nr:hypothetical protein [Acidimicrobiaceae bacterium]
MDVRAIDNLTVTVARPVAARKRQATTALRDIHNPTRKIAFVKQVLTLVNREVGQVFTLAAHLEVALLMPRFVQPARTRVRHAFGHLLQVIEFSL